MLQTLSEPAQTSVICPVPTPPPALEVRPIRDSRELDEVYRLTHDSYVERGYCQPQPDGRLIHYPHLDGIPETTVLIALCNGQIVGTNSLTFDGPAGLHVDKDFKRECDLIRAEGRKLAASWRIATRSQCRSQRDAIMALIQATVWLGCDSGVDTSVFTFNPRHERIYQRLLNMKTIAHSEGTEGLLAAPAVLMRLNRSEIPCTWMKGFEAGRYFRPTIVQLGRPHAALSA